VSDGVVDEALVSRDELRYTRDFRFGFGV